MRQVESLLLILFLLAFSSCTKEDDTTYPNVVTEMADLLTDNAGRTTTLLLDNGTSYSITNPKSGLKANCIYRVLSGYIPIGTSAQLYNTQGAYILNDSTNTQKADPTKVLSVWHTSRYINMHLTPLTQGGTQHWGIITDSIVDGHYYLRLHHNQNGDPTSYTTDVYASLPIGEDTTIPADNAITLRIQTFDGIKTYNFN